MHINLSDALKKREEKEPAINLNELKNYKLVLKYPNKIKKGDIVLNGGLTDEIRSEIYNGRFIKRFLSDVYGVYINKKLDSSSNLYEIYKSSMAAAAGKRGLDRALMVAASVYSQLYYRMMEYTDSYSKKKGIMTSADLLYLDKGNSLKGKAVDIEYSLVDGPFLCHEFAVTLSFLLDKEKRRTGLKPFYVMGMVEIYGEKAEHCWVELRNKKDGRILFDPIYNVVQPLNEGQVYVVAANGTKYWIDNGPLILRRSY
jgi:hypothetical protein